MPIHVRLADKDDLDRLIDLNKQIQDLHASFYPDVFPTAGKPEKIEKFFKKLIGAANTTLIVADFDNEVAGYLWSETFHKRQSLFSKGKIYLYIQHICVDHSLRRKGIATALFKHMENQARGEEISEIRLGTWALNTKAHAFFNAHGFDAYHIDMKKKL